MKITFPGRRGEADREPPRGRPRGGRGRLPRAWPTYAIGLAALVVLVAGITSLGSSSSGATAGRPTATVTKGVVQSTVSGTGNLEPTEQVELNFGSSGEVTAVEVGPGQKVHKGQVLARIDSSAAEASLAQARAELAEAEEALEGAEEAEDVSTALDDGGEAILAADVVGAGEAARGATATEGTPPPCSASGEVGRGEPAEPAAVEKARKEAEVAVREAEEAKREAAAASSSAAARESSEAATAAPGRRASGTISVATAEAKLREARLAVRSARQEVDETALRAPIDGTVASVSGEVGEIVPGEASAAVPSSGSRAASSSDPLAALAGASTDSESAPTAFIVLSRLGRMQMEVTLSEADIDKVRVGQPATVSISALEGSEVAGKVVQVGLLPEEGEVVEYPATIELTQGAEGVRAGMSASAEIVVEQASNAISVPTEAITALGQGKTVTVEQADGDEVEKTVTTGLEGDEQTQVIEGLEPGEIVVLPEIGAVPGVLGDLLGEKATSGLGGAAAATPGALGGGGRLRSLLGG